MPRIVVQANKAGAGLVRPILSDEEIKLARYRFARSFDHAPGWLYEGVAKAFGANTARLAIVGEDPMLLANEDPAKVARQQGQFDRLSAGAQEDHGLDINWNIVAYSTVSWAKRVFSGDEYDVAVRGLAEAIFPASRVEYGDPVAAWNTHNAALAGRTEWLNARKFGVATAFVAAVLWLCASSIRIPIYVKSGFGKLVDEMSASGICPRRARGNLAQQCQNDRHRLGMN